MRAIGPGPTLCLSIVMLGGVLLGCQRTQPPAIASSDRPECPHSWATYFLPAEADGDSGILGSGGGGRNANSWLVPGGGPSAFLISRDVSDVPEFHDCQRLIVTSQVVSIPSGRNGGPTPSKSYGEMAAVLVRYRFDAVLLARLGSEGNDSIGTTGLPAAEIISEGEYLPLGIQAGFNCLLLAENGKAWMVAMGRDHRGFQCDTLAIGTRTRGTATLLSVSMDPPERDVAAVPPVTRWEWDSLSGQQLIGIKCRPRVWCTVGPTGHHAMPGRVFANNAPLPRARGWLDEQYLADVMPTTSTAVHGAIPLRVTPIVGTAYPAEHLEDWTMQSGHNVWIPVAYVALSGPLPPYENKLGLSNTPHASNGLAALNSISFCAGNRQGCGVPLRVRSCSSTPEIWAKVTSPIPLASGSSMTYLCVRYRPHSALSGAAAPFDIPAVVRWRWKPNDETMWVRCPAGCCEVFADV